MFHGFQMMNHDSRFPDELDALYNYKYEEDNLNLKLTENQLLCRLSIRFEKALFEELLQIRADYNKNCVIRRFFKSFQKSVESSD